MDTTLSLIERSPVIAAVKSEAQLDAALSSPCSVIFLLCGNICTIHSLVEHIHAAGKKAIVHLDLISGLAPKDSSIDFLSTQVHADGVISTRPNLLRRAKELGLFSVLRVFVIDSMAFDNITRETAMVTPDIIEVLPGIMPKVIHQIASAINVPIVAGGLIADKSDIISALSAGALAVSTSNAALWQT